MIDVLRDLTQRNISFAATASINPRFGMPRANSSLFGAAGKSKAPHRRSQSMSNAALSETPAATSSVKMDEQLSMAFVRVVELAALAAARAMGIGERETADQAAVEAMRKAFDDLPISGEVVIGEGERDEAPMLYIGEMVGAQRGCRQPDVDIAVDPLD
jgi:hypothetical protein